MCYMASCRLALLSLLVLGTGCKSKDQEAAESAAIQPATELAFAAIRHHAELGVWPASVRELADYDSAGWAGYAGRNMGFRPDGVRRIDLTVVNDSIARLAFEFVRKEVDQDLFVHYQREGDDSYGSGGTEWIDYRPTLLEASGNAVLTANDEGGHGTVTVSDAEVRLPESERVFRVRGHELDISTWINVGGRMYLRRE